MTAREFFDRLPASNEILDDPPNPKLYEFTEEELYRFAEAYAQDRIKALYRENPIIVEYDRRTENN